MVQLPGFKVSHFLRGLSPYTSIQKKKKRPPTTRYITMPGDVLPADSRPGEPLLSKQRRGPRSGLKRAKSRPRITQPPTSPELPHPASPQGSSPHPSSLPPSQPSSKSAKGKKKKRKKIIIKPTSNLFLLQLLIKYSYFPDSSVKVQVTCHYGLNGF